MSPYLFAGLFAAWAALMAAYPVFPPVARQLGLTELQTGMLISLSAVLMAVAGPFWGERSERWGRKPVFLIGLVGAGVAIALFAVVVDLGLSGMVAGPALFVLLVLARMPLGLLVAAAPVAAQALVADTTDAENRGAGMAMIGAANGLGLIVGPAAAALLVAFGLLVPFYAGAAAVLAVAAVVAVGMPAPDRRAPRAPKPPLRPWDGRIWPFLLVGFFAVMMISVVQVSVGFFLIDRIGLSVQQAAQSGSLAFLTAGVVLVLSQAVLIPRLKWFPSRLLRVGLPLMAIGFVGLLAAPATWAVHGAFAVIAAGAGMTFPAFQAGVTLMVDDDEQGAVAGLTTASNATGAIVGPLAGTALYQAAPAFPYATGAVLLALLTAFVWLHPRIASAETEASGQAPAV